MAGRGRGRDLTLPSWLTTTPQENSNGGSPQAPVATEIPEQFQNATSPVESPPSVPMNQTANQYSSGSAAQIPLPFFPPVGSYNHVYTPFNPAQLPISNPLSLVTVAVTPPQIIRQSVAGVVPLTSLPTPGLYPQPLVPAQLTTPAALPQASQAPSFNDANNDASSWSEHEGDDRRKYWYNRVTQTSTYDKPECLKCPEERSIPPCRWKEYSADGKIYYSDGKESSWAMPEEFRQWKEQVDAAVARRKAALQQSASQSLAPPAVVTAPAAAVAPTASTTTATHPTRDSAREHTKPAAEHKKHSQAAPVEAAPVVEPIVYPTHEAAVEAFRSLLDEFQVTSTMKYKEVQDLCSHDQRWNALKSTGEKKQNLAEFQTKKMKQEKEVKKVLARRARDNFFLLLAECQAIDSSTRWRDAIALLENDKRYKEVESAYEREDYFNDFITELKKRERLEREEMKNEIIQEYQLLLRSLVESGKVTYQSNWNELRSEMVEVFSKGKLNLLEDFEKRRVFQDLLHELISAHREEERRLRQEKLEILQTLKDEFQKEIEQLLLSSFSSSVSVSGHSSGGGRGDDPRWRDLAPMLEASVSFQKILNFNDAERTKQQQQQSPSLKLFSPRDIFEEFMAHRREELRFHRRVLFDILGNYHVEITHKTSIENETLPKLQEIFDLNKESEGKTRNGNGGGSLTTASAVPCQLTSKEMGTLLNLLTTKKSLLLQLLTEIVERKREDWEEKERLRRKLEDRYLDLLDDLFNRSDQIDLTWDEAKKELFGRSAFEDLGKTERKRFFYEHMRELREKLEVKLIKTNEVKQLEENKLLEVMREKEKEEEEAAATAERAAERATAAEREAAERVAVEDQKEKQSKEEEKLKNKEREREREGNYSHRDGEKNGHSHDHEMERGEAATDGRQENGRGSSRRREARESEDRHSLGSRESESRLSERDRDREHSSRHRKRSRHDDSSDREEGEESRGGKSHKKDKKDKDKDRDRDRDRDKDKDRDRDRERSSRREDKDRGRKHKKHRKESRDDRSRSRSAEREHTSKKSRHKSRSESP